MTNQTTVTPSMRPFEHFSTAMLTKVALRNPKGKYPEALELALQYELHFRRQLERRKKASHAI